MEKRQISNKKPFLLHLPLLEYYEKWENYDTRWHWKYSFMTLEQFSILFVFEKNLMVIRIEPKLDICM